MNGRTLLIVTTRETGPAVSTVQPCKSRSTARLAAVEEIEARSLGSPNDKRNDWAVSIVCDGREVLSAGSGAGVGLIHTRAVEEARRETRQAGGSVQVSALALAGAAV